MSLYNKHKALPSHLFKIMHIPLCLRSIWSPLCLFWHDGYALIVRKKMSQIPWYIRHLKHCQVLTVSVWFIALEWQCEAVMIAPWKVSVPTYSTLLIDACFSKLSDHKRIAATYCGSILGLWEHGRATDLFFLLPKVGLLSLGAGSLLGLRQTWSYHMIGAVAEVVLVGLWWQVAFLGMMVCCCCCCC